eukprot:scaffold3153_cov111-Isochrysis_galbana.AAC.5
MPVVVDAKAFRRTTDFAASRRGRAQGQLAHPCVVASEHAAGHNVASGRRCITHRRHARRMMCTAAAAGQQREVGGGGLWRSPSRSGRERRIDCDLAFFSSEIWRSFRLRFGLDWHIHTYTHPAT